jgi:hypothetical protein
MPLFDRPPVHDFPDRAFRDALEQVANLRDVLVEAVPDIASHLVFEQARYIKPAFLLEDWRGRESDLLCLIPYRVSDTTQELVLICILLEHQSRADPLMPLRVLLYAVLFWEQQWKEYERRHEEGAALRLTPVIPIVFHTGSRDWSSNRSLAELFEGPEVLRAYAPEWPLVFWDLAARTPEQLLASDGPFAQFLALVRAEQSDAERFRQIFTQLAEQLEPLAGQDKMRWRDLLWLMLSWVLQRRPAEDGQTLSRTLVEQQHDLALREEAQTVTEATKQTWVQKNMAELERLAQKRADERAEALGAVRSHRETLIAVLSGAFGEVPAPIQALIQGCADIDRLRAAILQVSKLKSLDEFQL